MSQKTFIIDWDCLADLETHWNKVKSRVCELRIANGAMSRKMKKRDVFDACSEILDTDISVVYSCLLLDAEKRYYVYAHGDTSHKIAVGANGLSTFAASLGLSYIPFYIGKGTGGRCNELDRPGQHRKIVQKMRRLDRLPEVTIIRSNLSESEALQLESKLIDIFGLVPYGGVLANLDEGVSPTERRKLYMSQYTRLRDFNKIPPLMTT